jgi:small subunit ribosomal protein S17
MTECNDKRCPVHGSLRVRGNIFSGIVVSAKPSKTAIVERTIVKYVPKFERYKKSRARITAHNPDCIGAKEDDVVKVGETRRLSKTKSFVVLKVVGKKKVVKIEEDTFHKRESKPGEEAKMAKKEMKPEEPGSGAKEKKGKKPSEEKGEGK